jgi:hypothetical protein
VVAVRIVEEQSRMFVLMKQYPVSPLLPLRIDACHLPLQINRDSALGRGRRNRRP